MCFIRFRKFVLNFCQEIHGVWVLFDAWSKGKHKGKAGFVSALQLHLIYWTLSGFGNSFH